VASMSCAVSVHSRMDMDSGAATQAGPGRGTGGRRARLNRCVVMASTLSVNASSITGATSTGASSRVSAASLETGPGPVARGRRRPVASRLGTAAWGLVALRLATSVVGWPAALREGGGGEGQGGGFEPEQPTDRGAMAGRQRVHERSQLFEGGAGDELVDGHEVTFRGGQIQSTPGSAYPQPEPNATELPSSAPGRLKLVELRASAPSPTPTRAEEHIATTPDCRPRAM